MSKGQRIRERRRGSTHGQADAHGEASSFGFCLANTAANRNLVRQITGQSPERFITSDGMLDSDFEQRKTAIPQAPPCKPL